jgi:hypothetical protein
VIRTSLEIGIDPNGGEHNPSADRDQAAQGALILHRLVPAPDHGAGFRRDVATGFVYYSSDWLGDERTPMRVVR